MDKNQIGYNGKRFMNAVGNIYLRNQILPLFYDRWDGIVTMVEGPAKSAAKAAVVEEVYNYTLYNEMYPHTFVTNEGQPLPKDLALGLLQKRFENKISNAKQQKQQQQQPGIVSSDGITNRAKSQRISVPPAMAATTSTCDCTPPTTTTLSAWIPSTTLFGRKSPVRIY